MSEVASISRYGKTEPIELQIARGQIAWHSLVNIQGYNAAVPTTFTAVWELANTTAYVYPASAVAMTFTSGSSETLTMTVSGLDDSYVLKTAVVTFSGSTTGTVTSGTSTFFRINYMQITSGTSIGNISATNNGTTYSYIGLGAGRSQASIYTVPAGHSFCLLRAQCYTHNNGNQNATYRIYTQVISNGITTPSGILTAPFTNDYTSVRVIPRAYTEKTDIQWQMKQSTPAAGSIQVEGLLVRNDA